MKNILKIIMLNKIKLLEIFMRQKKHVFFLYLKSKGVKDTLLYLI